MSDPFLRYLDREHARIEALIAEEQRRLRPDAGSLARLKKAKLIVKDQKARWQADYADYSATEAA